MPPDNVKAVNLKTPFIWEKVEKECRDLRYGELSLVVKVKDGVAQHVDVERSRKSFQNQPDPAP